MSKIKQWWNRLTRQPRRAKRLEQVLLYGQRLDICSVTIESGQICLQTALALGPFPLMVPDGYEVVIRKRNHLTVEAVSRPETPSHIAADVCVYGCSTICRFCAALDKRKNIA